MKHIIITRVNMPQDLDPNKYNGNDPGSSNEWTKKRVEMMDIGVRNQLDNQTNKNFTHYEIWRSGTDFKLFGNYANRQYNNKMIFINKNDLIPKNAAELAETKLMKGDLGGVLAIRNAIIKDLPKGEFILITNIDSDDSISIDFVDEIQYMFNRLKYDINLPFFIDVQANFRYHIKSKKVGVHQTKSCSMFGSVVETSNNLKLFYYLYGHSNLHKYMKGFKMQNQFGCMLVHDDNIFTKSISNKDSNYRFNINDYFKGLQ